MTRWIAALQMAIAIALSTPVTAQDRAAVDDRYKWNLGEIYASEDAWDKSRRAVLADIATFAATKEKRLRSARELVAALGLRDRIGERASRLAVYASMRRDLDTRDGRSQQMDQQARETIVAFRAAAAWIRPAILALGAAKVREFIKADPRLAPIKARVEAKRRYVADRLLFLGSLEADRDQFQKFLGLR